MPGPAEDTLSLILSMSIGCLAVPNSKTSSISQLLAKMPLSFAAANDQPTLVNTLLSTALHVANRSRNVVNSPIKCILTLYLVIVWL
jgi:hypothetical protein